MIVIGNTIISDDLYQVRFSCQLGRCQGACCVAGDAGAPLEESEIAFLEDHLDELKPYLTERGREIIETQGVFDYDIQGNFVTPLINDGECAFANFEQGRAYCAIEKASEHGWKGFQKPLSCHLYPVRISRYEKFEAVNYQKWSICKPALKQGKKLGTPLYKFLKVPLTRKYGREWYRQLEQEIIKVLPAGE